jgi:hypothetical protein
MHDLIGVPSTWAGLVHKHVRVQAALVRRIATMPISIRLLELGWVHPENVGTNPTSSLFKETYNRPFIFYRFV